MSPDNGRWVEPWIFEAALEKVKREAEQVKREAFVWKEQALKHCNRADRAEMEIERLRALLMDGSDDAR